MNRLVCAVALAAIACMPAAVLAQAKPIMNDQSITVLQGIGFGSLNIPATPVDATRGLPVNTVVQGVATDRGGLIGTSAVTIMAANATRRGFSVQNQSASASCYINGTRTATADYHSLVVGPTGYFEPDHHVGTGAISIICTAASTPVYAREW